MDPYHSICVVGGSMKHKAKRWKAWAGIKNGNIKWEELPNDLAACPSLYRTKKQALEEGFYDMVIPVTITPSREKGRKR